MANEALVFSLTTAELAAGAAKQAGGGNVDIADEDTGTVTASIDIGLYALKAAFNGADGKNKLLFALEQIKNKVAQTTFPVL